MCRHASYTGPPISLDKFLLSPSHGLVEQSYKPNEMLTAQVNADGFGIGWYLDDGTARRYVNPVPIWSDPNVLQLGPALQSKLWLANVRSATLPESNTRVNTPPYGVGSLLFSHNGFIVDFAAKVRPTVRRYLAPEIEADVHGNTDSEYLFAVIRQMLRDHKGDVKETLNAFFDQICEWMGDTVGLFNFLILDGDKVYATRHAVGHEPPSLYLGHDEVHFPDGWLIASEPFDNSGEWVSVPKNHMVILSPGSRPEQTTL